MPYITKNICARSPRDYPGNHSKAELRRLLSTAVASATAAATDAADSPHVRIVPLNQDGQPGRSQAVEVQNCDQRSIKFQHPMPLHDRRALVVLEGSRLGRLAAEVDLSWCRFTRAGQYTSGGRFVQLTKESA